MYLYFIFNKICWVYYNIIQKLLETLDMLLLQLLFINTMLQNILINIMIMILFLQ